MRQRMIYFRDTHTVECWRVVAGYWSNLGRDAFDDLSVDEYDYYAFDTKPKNWLGDKKDNPMPFIQL